MNNSGLKKIRLLVVDDHALVRKGIHALIKTEPGMEIIGEADNGRDAVRLARELFPGCDPAGPYYAALERHRRYHSD